MSLYIEVDTTVEVDLGEIDTETLTEELQRRGCQLGESLMSELSTDFLLSDKDSVLLKIRELVSSSGYPV